MSFYFMKSAIDEVQPVVTPLHGDRTVNVAIVGGGFSGLWTAYHLLKTDPDLKIAIIERGICGSGASGRNGGMVGDWRFRALSLVSALGAKEAIRLIGEVDKGILAIEAFCEKHCPEAHFTPASWAWAALNKQQVGVWGRINQMLIDLGVGAWQVLDTEDTARVTGSKQHIAAAYRDTAEIKTGQVQPAALALGLRRFLVGEGVDVFEKTQMKSVSGGTPAQVRTASGTVKADAVVLAMNAWAHELPRFRRSVLPIQTDVILTKPIPDRLKAVGLYKRPLAISTPKMQVAFYSNTHDNRFFYQRGGTAFPFAGRVGDRLTGSPSPIADDIRDEMVHVYPEFRDAALEDSWYGVIARTESGLPAFGEMENEPNVFYGHGYGGAGLGPTYVGGQILRSLALGLEDEWSSSPIVAGISNFLPREPIRYLAGRVIQHAAIRKDRLQTQDKQIDRITNSLCSLLPSGVVPMVGTAENSEKKSD